MGVTTLRKAGALTLPLVTHQLPSSWRVSVNSGSPGVAMTMRVTEAVSTCTSSALKLRVLRAPASLLMP